MVERTTRNGITRALYGRAVLVLVMVLGCAGSLGRGESTAVMIDECRYASDAAGSAVWRPMAGTARAGVSTIEGRQVLRLRCDFAGGKVQRASWDRPVKLDLGASQGIQFRILCRDASPVSFFSIYFQSGEGWYHASFFPESSSGWNTIRIDKAEMKPEGKPAGWSQIKTIRISAWRGADVNTEFYLSDIRRTGVLGVDALVAVLGAESAVEHRTERGREAVAQQFQALEVGCAILGERELTPQQLQPARLVVLPQNPSLPDGAVAALAQYLRHGGKLLAFYNVPEKLRSVTGPTNCLTLTRDLWSGDTAGRRRALLAKASALVPEIGRQAAEASLGRIGQVASFNSYEAATNQIGRLVLPESAAAKALASAASLRASALQLAAQKKFAEAMEQATAAHEQLTAAWCLAQQPLPGEFRAFWCHSAFGVRDMDWDEAIRRLAENGFTAILPNMLWGGAAFYDSKVLPVASQAAERGDQIRQCLAACRKYGLQMHVWKVDWNLGSAAPKEFVEKMRRAGRLQASAGGKEEPWLCPSHPENQKLEIDAMLEVVRNYDVDGIHFDYIRYPDGEHCFCAGCKERFGRACGGALRSWPQDVLAEGPLREQWLEWRRANITAVVWAVSEQARALKPKIKISAAVFRHWNTDRDGVGQDWKVWCDKGYLDFVCPMDYTPFNRNFENMVAQQVRWAGRVPCYPGLGVSASSSRFGPDRAVEQINIARRYGTRGFVIFNYGMNESKELLPMLGGGITRPGRGGL